MATRTLLGALASRHAAQPVFLLQAHRRALFTASARAVAVPMGRLSMAASNTLASRVPLHRSYCDAVAKTIPVPNMGDSITEGSVLSFNKAVGDFVEADEVIAEIETDKVTVEIRAPEPGTIKALFCGEGDTVEVGADFFSMVPGASQGGAKAPAGVAPPAAVAAAPPPLKAPATAPPPPKADAAAPVEEMAPRERRVKMTRMRLRTAERLKESQNTAAMLTTFNEIDMSTIIALRKQYQDAFTKKHGVKLGFMSLFVKAATIALEDQPAVNAIIDGTDIVYRDYIDISVAVASPKGLVVPVLRSCEEMGMADIEKAIGMYGDKAKNNQLALEDMTGGTFTISNGGVFGSLMGTPLINQPQAAILGMHGTFERPVARNGQVVIRPMMYVALTYDHRLIDGREAVTFLKKIKDVVEDPTRALLDC